MSYAPSNNTPKMSCKINGMMLLSNEPNKAANISHLS